MTNVKKSLLICEVDKSGKVCEVLVRAVLANQPHPVDTDARRRRRREVPEAMEVLLDDTAVKEEPSPGAEALSNSNSVVLDDNLLNGDRTTSMPPWRRRTLCHCAIT